MYDFEAIKDNHPLLDFIIEDTGEMPSRSGKWNLFFCPLPDHTDVATPSFGIANNGFYCFGCGKKGDLFDYLRMTRGWNIKTAIEKLGGGYRSNHEDKLALSILKAKKQSERLAEEIKKSERALKQLRRDRAWIVYQEYLKSRPDMQFRWMREGLPKEWQEFFGLGFAPHFYAGESLTIPIRTPFEDEPVNVRHRIIGAAVNKYRPERKGLPTSLYWANPKMGVTKHFYLVEGEKKAMVLFRFLKEAGKETQVIGIIGKNGLKSNLVPPLKEAERMTFIPDPDLTVPQVAGIVAGIGIETEVKRLPIKIDDGLNDGRINIMGL